MNIVQLHYKVQFYLDSVQSPRFNPDKIDDAINAAINDIILDRYDNIRKNQREKNYGFQTSQRLRDELSTLVNQSGTVAASGNVIPRTNFPSDYMLMLSMKANISGQIVNTIPATYDEINILDLNPFLRPSIVEPERVYRIESQNGVEIIFGDLGVLNSASFDYIATPATVNIGTQHTGTTEADEIYATNYATVIAYVPSVISQMGSARGQVLNTVNLSRGELYTIGTGSENRIRLSSGILYKGYTETDLPTLLHEELCRQAAKILSGSTSNYDMKRSLEEDIKNTE